jgi:DNA-binding LacI/PurR family transcriptional regulator
MLDVARVAGVSGQTVSRVANGRQNVDAATRERVLEAMREVGYRPNSAARALRNGQFRSIGVIMFALSSFGNIRTLDAIAEAAARYGYSITLLPVSKPSQPEIAGAFSRLGEAAVDGIIILIEAHQLNEAEVEVPDGLPVVVVDSSAHYAYPVVDTNQAEGARQATEHLLDLGHRTVWHVAGPSYSYSAERRRQSWETTLREHRRRVPGVIEGDWTAASGYVAGQRLAKDPKVTAVFAANDHMALGLLRAFAEADRPVPESVSVVGFDDMDESANYQPPLTTVHQFFAEVGRRTVNALVAEIQSGAGEAGADLVGTELVVRGSTAPPPGKPGRSRR